MLFQVLLLSASLEMGYLSGGVYNYQTKNEYWTDIGALYVSLESNIRYKNLYVGGKVYSYFTPTSFFNYSPFQMTYVFQTGIDFKGVQIGYEHSCFHPIQPYATVIKKEIKPKYEGGYNSIWIRFSTK